MPSIAMRLVQVLLLGSTVVAFANGKAFQYSSGWSPGEATQATPSPSTAASYKPGSSVGRFSWTSLLTSGPIGTLFARTGINMTEKLTEAQRKAYDLPWDDRIPMIRDDNFETLIFNETFDTPEEEEARLWFLVVTVTSNQRTGISAFVDQQFNEAYNTSLAENDLPHVRWGRIDYINVTRLTTKWAVWRAPMFILAKDRGKTLRFFHPQEVGSKASLIHAFLVEEIWRRRQPWTGPWAPGGSREDYLDMFAIFQGHLYFYMSMIPSWMFLVLSGTLGTIILNLFHRKTPTAAAPVTAHPQPSPVDTTQPQEIARTRTDPPRVGTKKGGTQKRRGSKK